MSFLLRRHQASLFSLLGSRLSVFSSLASPRTPGYCTKLTYHIIKFSLKIPDEYLFSNICAVHSTNIFEHPLYEELTCSRQQAYTVYNTEKFLALIYFEGGIQTKNDKQRNKIISDSNRY